jgi:sulfatase maturation enzyme AslB (radical SAM superfamily)
MEKTVYRSASGITIRKDNSALFGFSHEHGFAFFAPSHDFEILKTYLSSVPRRKRNMPKGYDILFSATTPFPLGKPRILGDTNYEWKNIPIGETPLIINWMITGKCNYHCAYCYAMDLMKKSDMREPDSDEALSVIIKNIESYQPVAVVVTGGEPRLSPFFATAIEKLSKFTSVVIDTNATLICNEDIELFRGSKVHLRISIDASDPATNKKNRIPLTPCNADTDHNKIWNWLSVLAKNKIPITINTVATKSNYTHIINGLISDLFNKSKQTNPQKIRVRLVENSASISDYDGLVGSKNSLNSFRDNIRKLSNCEFLLPLYYTDNRPRNSIILVAPDGSFYTESQLVEQGKIIIDDKQAQKPSISALKNQVDFHAHFNRYLVS